MTDTNHIREKLIEDEMKESYIDYAMSVIVGRALPDVRDGLKPVHRRVLFTMHELSLQHNKTFKKCARIVGDCLGRYHPHGDTAVYDTLVRMAQDFSLRYPLVKGQGNFGSIDGDSAAAMRYCITGDSLLLTSNGILPISSLSNKEESKINSIILSFNGQKNNAIKFFNSGKQDIIEIETEQGYMLRGSYNHPILCWAKGVQNKPLLQWKLLSDIKEGDIAVLQRNFSLFSEKSYDLSAFAPQNKRYKKISLPKKMSPDLAFLLGALVSEGSFHQHKVIFNNSDKVFYAKVKSIILSLFKGITLYERDIAGGCRELEIYHQHAVQFLINIGLREAKADKKSIPFSVMQSTKDCISSFLKGLFEGDGSVMFKIDKRHGGKSMELAYHSKSIALIRQLKTLLLNFGITTTSPYKDKRNDCYKLQITGIKSIYIFNKEIGFFSRRKNSTLAKCRQMNALRMSKTDFIPYLSNYIKGKYGGSFLNRNNIDRYSILEKNLSKLSKILDSEDKELIASIIKNRHYFNAICKVFRPKDKEYVFSVKVDSSCHSFVANGFINHNTEAKMQKIAEEMLIDIDKETVDFTPNFDGTMQEPLVLPARFPNLLVNGSTGIAVGMATNIPPHNLSEVADATLMLLDNPETDEHTLNTVVKGPDFPTGGIICGTAGIRSAYLTGKGRVKVRAKTEIEEKNSKHWIIVKEIPYMVNKSSMIEEIARQVNEKLIEGITDIRDESDREGIRIAIELKRNMNPDVVLNQLYKRTPMESTFGIIMLALHNNQPKVMALKEFIMHYIGHRKDVIVRRSRFELKKAEERIHILEGLKIALLNIDEVVRLIKKAANAADAKSILVQSYELSEIQAQAILDMKLQKLTSLEQDKLHNEIDEITKFIADLKDILSSEKRVISIIKNDLLEIKQLYGDDRRTEITEAQDEIVEEDLIPDEDVVITATYSGYIKKTQLEEYRQQKRGGYGIVGAETKEEDDIEHLITASTHSTILCFTNKGRLHWLKAYNIPTASRYSKGKAMVNLLNLEEGERVNTMIPLKEFAERHYLIMVTKKGLIKKTELDMYSNPRKGGIIAIKLMPNDELVQVRLTPGKLKFIVGTKKGNALRFDEADVRPMGRNAAGVRAIRLSKGDEVVGLEVALEIGTLLTVTENGYGKRSPVVDYRLIRRGGKGVINIKCSERNGDVVGIKTVMDHDEIMVMTQNGILIRMPATDISVIGRNTQGVRLMKIREGDKVKSIARIVKKK